MAVCTIIECVRNTTPRPYEEAANCNGASVNRAKGGQKEVVEKTEKAQKKPGNGVIDGGKAKSRLGLSP